MKTEKAHFTATEIQENIQALRDDDLAIQCFEREPTPNARALLNDISRVGLLNSADLRDFLHNMGLRAPAFNAPDNDKVIRSIDMWIDIRAEGPRAVAAGLVAQVPHMIARDWRERERATTHILLLESAMYRLAALQLEADSQWMEDTASEGDPGPVDISGDPVIDRVLTWVRDTFPGARMDGIQQPDIPDWLVGPLRQTEQKDTGTDCLILAGCYEFGTQSYAGKMRFHRNPEDNVQVAIPNGMRWSTAVGNLKKVTEDLEFWISVRTDTAIKDLDMITEREIDSPFPPF